jgi:hypothetical protein
MRSPSTMIFFEGREMLAKTIMNTCVLWQNTNYLARRILLLGLKKVLEECFSISTVPASPENF